MFFPKLSVLSSSQSSKQPIKFLKISPTSQFCPSETRSQVFFKDGRQIPGLVHNISSESQDSRFKPYTSSA